MNNATYCDIESSKLCKNDQFQSYRLVWHLLKFCYRRLNFGQKIITERNKKLTAKKLKLKKIQ